MPRKPRGRRAAPVPDYGIPAAEVAEFLVALFGSADWAEEIMDFTLQRCPDPDRAFWEAVRQAIAQIRG